MEILLDMFVAVHLVDRTFSDDMVSIVEAIVLHVVAKGGHNQGKGIRIVEAGMFSEVLLCEDQINVLGHI